MQRRDWIAAALACVLLLAACAAPTAVEAGIVNGDPVVPPSDAFRPCFERRPKTYGVGDEALEGFEWVRVPDIPDQLRRNW